MIHPTPTSEVSSSRWPAVAPTLPAPLVGVGIPLPANKLFYGDNLDVLRRHVKDESVDLVYLDPPFNSNANYNVLFAEHGLKDAAQIAAFGDTWEWNTEASAAYQETVEAGGEVAGALKACRTLVGTSDMLAYLSMMAPRLVELRRVLKPTGSVWLHCDPTTSHYLRILLDAIFKPANFRNEVIWQRTLAKALMTRRLPSNHDVVLSYQVSDEAQWNRDAGFQPYDHAALDEKTAGKYVHKEAGRLYRLDNLVNPNPDRPNLTYEFLGVTRVWRWTRERMQDAYERGLVVQKRPGTVPSYKRFLDEQKGRPLGDVWTDIPPINSQASERLGYPTQKPLALMERILQLASRPGDVVLDPFCGCGTTIDAAQALGRNWIGIDVTHLAIGLIKHRLADRYGPDIAETYRVVGEPTTVQDAAVLAKQDPFQFQAWALGLVGARVTGSDKKGGDGGVDGRLYFHDSTSGPTRQIVFSVKGGHLAPAYVRELEAVRQQQGAEIGVLISFEKPTAGMGGEAGGFGLYDSPWGRYPRLQLRTIRELLDGRTIEYPHIAGANVTHHRAPRAVPPAPITVPLWPGDTEVARRARQDYARRVGEAEREPVAPTVPTVELVE